LKLTRAEAIQKLFDLQEICVGQTIFLTHDDITAIRMGMSSLRTDEAYQLEYENRDCMEVVRCKDCIHYKGNSCEWHNGFMPPENWFCADGEVKE
jgi:hypothetical protein